MRKIILLITLCFASTTWAQDYFPTNSGVKATASGPVAFTEATIHVHANQVLENATLLVKDGKVVEVGTNVKIPKNAVEFNLNGKHIYPSFIDLYSDFGMKEVEKASSGPQYEPNRKGYYWNDHIRPEQQAVNHFTFDEKKAKAMREAGFGMVNSHVQDGVIRGTSALIALAEDENNPNKTIVNGTTAQYLGFSKSKQTRQSYPSSIMGMTALLRQTYNDANWYAKGNMKQKDLALEALNAQQNLPQIIHAGDYLNVLRADDVGDQFNIQYTIVGGGDEYKRIDEIKATQARFILPVNFPDAYDVEDPFMANYVSLEEMKHWQHAPRNLQYLAEAGVEFALTTDELKSPKELHKKLQLAIEKGLDPKIALRALTEIPAQILGMENQIGSLKKGSLANFIITSGDVFDKESNIYENWIQGQRNIIKDEDLPKIEGAYELRFSDLAIEIKIKEKSGKYSLEAKKDSLKLGTKITFEKNWLSFMLTETDSASTKMNRFSAYVPDASDEIKGKVILFNGNETQFTATKIKAEKKDSEDEASEEEEDSEKEEDSEEDHNKEEYLSEISFPNMAFGRSTANPEPEQMLIKNATVITGEDEGTLENTDVLLRDGKIYKIGKSLSDKNAKVIDGTGKYLTAGIIDEHSHIAASSVNEGGHNSSAEVTMEDVVNPDDISIYRALAGGVTTTQLLHGSANPIGGKSAILKMKWGASPKDMIYEDSPKFIKFALGENVKQSNWGNRSRFPQTRMGVEQVFMDYFSRAKAYGEKKASGKAYRYDEEMETLLEIINGERFISCHSYVQSEINMLMKVAEHFGFTVNTFTHILEGYKVADKMKEHGAGGSTFSDWWAYKYEVNDAIPYNAVLMHNEGVVTAINSDDGEMIRRLNQEAAKSMKYGGMSAEDAWKMVTLNPAKLLHIDHRVGSIKEGKEADLVLWSHHPLSIYTKAEQTLIGGVVYFDLEEDKKQRQTLKEDRARLIAELLKAKNKGMKTQAVVKKKGRDLHCDSLDSFLEGNFTETQHHH
ncbi:amidohydrolase family protein [Psychroflexus planctonicus]|uniref:Periplasmic amidohydrolase n=1 Tax=Psychroflexus planctonicus TaxID=1526575 RepID=A0ABQ1SJ45_9FLAO|nr:amidohydrolase family protein [Psychroflexus planctonicus]GGE38942.1 periplasmic amidohydrolase [Psychroflexus planctonicus]